MLFVWTGTDDWAVIFPTHLGAPKKKCRHLKKRRFEARELLATKTQQRKQATYKRRIEWRQLLARNLKDTRCSICRHLCRVVFTPPPLLGPPIPLLLSLLALLAQSERETRGVKEGRLCRHRPDRPCAEPTRWVSVTKAPRTFQTPDLDEPCLRHRLKRVLILYANYVDTVRRD